jgi:hypothetical protein
MTRNKNIFLIILTFGFSMQVIGQVNLQQGLVAYYPFNGNANDESGKENDGTVYGAALTTDRFGNQNSAYSFDGFDDFIKVSESTTLNPGLGSFSYSIWFKSNKYSNNIGYLIGKYDMNGTINLWQNTTWGLQLLFDEYNSSNNGIIGYFRDGISPQTSMETILSNTSNLNLNNWNFLSAIRDKSNGKIYYYLNGSLNVEINDISSEIFAYSDLIMGTHGNWGQYYDGQIDDIRIYNRALNQDEVNALYNEGIYPGEITITQVSQHSDGSGLVDVFFNLSGTANLYSISLEASFDGGTTYNPIPGSFLSGDIGPIQPGNSKLIVWDGVGSFPNIYSTQAKLKIVASQLGATCAGMPTITDIDGNIYNTVQIGSQCWMKENLRTTKYNDGSDIEYPGSDNNSWQNNTIGAYAWCNNDISWKGSYGAYYNWHAVSNTNGLCPLGWHVLQTLNGRS